MKPLLIPAALVAFGLAVPAFAQQATQKEAPPPYATTGTAPVCTQLELLHGIHGADCGKLSLTEISAKKFSHDNT